MFDLLFKFVFKGITYLQMAICQVFLLIQIHYPYIVKKNFPKVQENHASSF